MNRRVIALVGLLFCTAAYAAGTSIWSATDRGTVAATDRPPVATSGSSGPLYVTPATLDTYVSATSNALTNKTINGSSNTLTVLAGTQLSGQVPLANGGTGANLTDPNADRIAFWDDSAGAVTWLTAGTGLTITATSGPAKIGTGAMRLGVTKSASNYPVGVYAITQDLDGRQTDV